MDGLNELPLKVVVRYRDGRIVKGSTADFSPVRPWFTLEVAGEPGVMARCEVAELKALFFVKSWEGDRYYDESTTFEGAIPTGRAVTLHFIDGEVMSGFCPSIDRDRAGFFLVPVDPQSNNDRVFVVNSAVLRIEPRE